jgi:hypothetical protein
VVGWDGNYGLTVTTASSSPLAWKFGLQHVSSHIGDEYVARTGRERLNYTREELNVGAAWRWSPNWRAYGETGVAYYRGDPVLKPWRIQSGVEYESRLGLCSHRFACYAAADARPCRSGLASGQDRHVGIVIRSVGTSRLFLEWHDGRPPERILQRHDVEPQPGIRIDL